MLDVSDTPDSGTTVTDPSPPPYAPPPIGPRRLHRSTSDRMWQGVCGGIAEYLGVDPTVVRIGFVLLAITGGLGVVAYAAVWLLVPEEGQSAPTRRSPWQIAGAALLVLLLTGWADLWDGGPAIPLALVLIGGVLVWGGRDERPSASSAAPAAAPRSVVVEQRGEGRWSWAPSTEATEPIDPPPLAPTRRELRHVGRAVAVAVGGVLLAFGAISGAVAASDEIAATTFLGASLAGFGLLMALGSFWGWSRPLAFGALTVVLALAAVSIIDVPLQGGVGDQLLRPLSVDEIPIEERLAVGSLDIDLTLLDLTAADAPTIEASVAVGELVVTVPEGVTVELRADAGAGLVEAFGLEEEGVGAELDRVFRGTEGAGRIELDLAVGVGHLEVRRG
jgi:phage shock protein PspC (stress-responsive transcriptional regulator)